MDVKLIAFIMLGISGVGALLLIVALLLVKRKYRNNATLREADHLIIKKKSKNSDIFDRFYQYAYNVYVKIIFIKRYLKKIRTKLEMVNDYTEYQIRNESAKILTITLVLIFTSLFVVLSVISDLYRGMIIILIVMYIGEKFIDYMVTKVEDKILRQISDMFLEVRHGFHDHGMIEESLNEAIDNLGDKEIVPQVKRIKEALLSERPEQELERYYDTAPNRFLKLFAGICYLVMELGDRQVEGTSVFLKNLNNILNDVYLEILKRDKIDYMFRSLTLIAIAPIFFINPVKAWASANFPALLNFYDSSTGFVMETLLLVTIFGSYLMLKVVKDDTEKIKFDRVSDVKWQERLYKNRFVKDLIDVFMPRKNTTRYKKETTLIKNTNSYLTLEWFYVNKFTYFFVITIFSVLLIFQLHKVDVSLVYTAISEEFQSFGALSPEEQAAADAMAVEDAEQVKTYKKEENLTKEEFTAELAKDGKTYDEAAIDRLYAKVQKVQSAYFKWWELIIAILLGMIGYFIPNISLAIRNKMRQMEKENEIMQFQSIILMLMHIERIDVQTILEWLARYSYAFKEPITTALNNFEAGAVEALEQLKEDVPFKDFIRIVDGMISAVERIPVVQAFDELETERTFNYEKRKEANMRMVEKKVIMGKGLGFAPMVLLIGGFLVVPLILVSISQMMNYFSQMNTQM
ncbi:MAG: hypothetical protein RSB51_02455 [Clostridia bacterium]